MRPPDLPDISALPIPPDVRPGRGWTDQMIEMADHIGAYETLLIVDRYAGQVVYISADPERNRFRDLIGPEKAGILSHVYRRERLQIPTAKFALRHARRQGVIASVRAGQLTAAHAARILRTSRSYFSHLLNGTAEGTGAEPAIEPRARRRGLPGQMDLFSE